MGKKNGMKNEDEYIEWPQLNIKSNTIHAEMSAIINFLRKHKIKHTDRVNNIKFPKKLYVFSFNVKEKFRLSKPCESCLKLLKYYGVKKVVYSIKNDVVIEKVDEIKDTIITRGNLKIYKV